MFSPHAREAFAQSPAGGKPLGRNVLWDVLNYKTVHSTSVASTPPLSTALGAHSLGAENGGPRSAHTLLKDEPGNCSSQKPQRRGG